jgi:hypothetical protein
VLALAAALALTASATPAAPGRPQAPAGPAVTVEPLYLHDLSTPEGLVHLNWPSLSYDEAHGETLIVAEGFVRVFDASGQEVHRFGDDGSMGSVIRAVAVDDGDYVVLANQDGRTVLFRCDYRGEVVLKLALDGLPPELAGFTPDQLVYRDGRLYLAERGAMRVVVTSAAGEFARSYDLRRAVAKAAAAEEDRPVVSSLDAFNVDREGNLLFTMSTMFAAARLSTAGELRLFGHRGSRPGTFNIIGGIDADEQGRLYVTDRLRSVVSVWDRDLRFLAEFGYRGDAPTNIVSPYEVAVGRGRLSVAQAGNRGVKVFTVHFGEPEPTPGAGRLAPPPATRPPDTRPSR